MNRKMYQLMLLLLVSMTAYSRSLQSYRERYSDVIAHYAANDADSLKYQATLFLIDNMDGHMSPAGAAIVDYVCRVRTMKKSSGIRQLQSEWNNALKAGAVSYVPDSAVVSSSYLIHNIDDAFEAWDSAAWKDKVTFEQFCRYILPYKVNDEYIGDEWRKKLRQQYQPLVEGVADIKRAFAIVKDSVFKSVVLSNDYCPYDLDPLTCHVIGRAECGQRCILLVAVLRSLGIPVAIDSTPMWADYSHKGHAWVAMVASNGDTYTVYEQDSVARMFNPVDASEFLPRYKIKPEDNCPYTIKETKTPVKIYRVCFDRKSSGQEGESGMLGSPFLMDVSAQYGLTANVRLNVGNVENVYLCSYLSGSDWMPVARASSLKGEAVFPHVGKGSVCVVATIRNGERVFLSHPFLVGESGIERWIAPSETQKQTIRINRKYPLCSYTTDTWGYMRGATFEGSMTEDFAEVDILATITSMPYGMTSIVVSPVSKYRYLRYHAPMNNRSSLAELRFYGIDDTGDMSLLRGSYFGMGVDSSMIKQAFDGNASTICRGLTTGYTLGIDLGKDKETAITKIEFCPSTDLNFVEPGHLYELYYFDTDWHLLGREYSRKDYLEFQNVPVGALLLLKDKSAGKEERIFEYVNNQQIWH